MNLKFLKKEKSLKKISAWLNIQMYWQLAALFIFVSIIFAALFGIYMFHQINDEIVNSTNANISHLKTISKERIDKTLEYFDNRAKESDNILYSPSPVIDPSL